MYRKTFTILFIIGVGYLFFQLSSPVNAAGCIHESSLSGTCQLACGAGEIDAEKLNYISFTVAGCPTENGDPNAKTCCVQQNDGLCQSIGAEYAKTENPLIDPSFAEQVYNDCMNGEGGLPLSAETCQENYINDQKDKKFPTEESGYACQPSGCVGVVPGDLCKNGTQCCINFSSGDSKSSDASKTDATKKTAGSDTKLKDPMGGATVFTIIRRITNVFIGMVGALALFVFVIGGIMWMTAGSSERVKLAQGTIKYAVIGLALIVFAYAITKFFLEILDAA